MIKVNRWTHAITLLALVCVIAVAVVNVVSLSTQRSRTLTYARNIIRVYGVGSDASAAQSALMNDILFTKMLPGARAAFCISGPQPWHATPLVRYGDVHCVSSVVMPAGMIPGFCKRLGVLVMESQGQLMWSTRSRSGLSNGRVTSWLFGYDWDCWWTPPHAYDYSDAYAPQPILKAGLFYQCSHIGPFGSLGSCFWWSYKDPNTRVQLSP